VKALKDAAVGDKLILIHRTGRLTNGKSDDRTVEVVVTEAKRINLAVQEIEAKGDSHQRTWNVRRDNRKESVDSSGYGWHAYTVEEHENSQRTREAWTFLHEQGISISSSVLWRGREIELADLIRAHLAKDLSPVS